MGFANTLECVDTNFKRAKHTAKALAILRNVQKEILTQHHIMHYLQLQHSYHGNTVGHENQIRQLSTPYFNAKGYDTVKDGFDEYSEQENAHQNDNGDDEDEARQDSSTRKRHGKDKGTHDTTEKKAGTDEPEDQLTKKVKKTNAEKDALRKEKNAANTNAQNRERMRAFLERTKPMEETPDTNSRQNTKEGQTVRKYMEDATELQNTYGVDMKSNLSKLRTWLKNGTHVYPIMYCACTYCAGMYHPIT